MEAEVLPTNRQYVKATGDIFGTFMAWLDHTEAGGSTAFCQPGYEGVISPVRGKFSFCLVCLNGQLPGGRKVGIQSLRILPHLQGWG